MPSSAHTDPRLQRLLGAGQAPLPPPAAAAAPAYAVAQQADGHGSVRFRKALGDKTLCFVPDGARLRTLGAEGAWLRVDWEGMTGYVKARNVTVVRGQPCRQTEQAPAPSVAAGTCTVTVNGTQYTIDPSTDATTTVHDWLVMNVQNTGIRRSCGIGHCGSCVCMLSYTEGGETRHRSFNACLRRILSCNGMSITTGQGIGTVAGPHPTQSQLAKNNGTQCGFCSVGMVMNLYSHLMEKKGQTLSSAELDNLVDGNYCRCTGYRPILDSYKSFASTPPLQASAAHLQREQLFGRIRERVLPAPHAGAVPLPSPVLPTGATPVLRGTEWTECSTEAELQAALQGLQKAGTSNIQLIVGGTAYGLYYAAKYDATVNIAGIATLRGCAATSAGVEIGAAVAMSDAMGFLAAQAASAPAPKGVYFQQVVDHARIAPGNSIRNTGSVGGNVSIMKINKFPSEWPLLLHAVGATVTVVDALTGSASALSFEDYYALDMGYKYIQKFTLPWGVEGQVVRTFKTSSRHTYDVAKVAATMSCVVAGGKVAAGSARVVYTLPPIPGSTSRRLASVEALLNGCTVTDQAYFQSKLLPAVQAAMPSTDAFAASVGTGFFYKFMLGLQPSLPAKLQSAAAAWLPRAVTSGSQAFQTDPSLYPLGEAIPKLDGLKQCTGEAQYVQDIPIPAGALHAAPVLAAQLGAIGSIDHSTAAGMPGFHSFLSGADSPGNLMTGLPLFAVGKTNFIGQYVGAVLADTPEHAVAAARTVYVSYSSTSPAVIDIDGALKAGSAYIVPTPSGTPFSVTQGDVQKGFSESDHVTEDVLDLEPQYHYHMEKQSDLAVPTESGVVVHAATQLLTICHSAVAGCVGLGAADVEIKLRRCGGGFGGKLDNSMHPACLAAWLALKVKKPVRLIFELADNMRSAGLRTPYKFNTKVGYMKDGTIKAVQATVHLNVGALPSPVAGSLFDQHAFLGSFDNCYNVPNWDIKTVLVKTDLPPNTAMRAPGWLQGVFFAERVVGTVVNGLGGAVSGVAIKEKMMYKKGDMTPYKLPLNGWTMDQLWPAVKKSSNYDARLKEVQAYNAANRWTKKGITVVPSKFAIGGYNAIAFDCQVKVNPDGTVALMTGGTEIGQGLTTKVAQVVAYHLGIDIGLCSFQEQTTKVLAMTDVTGGSTSSELTCLAAKNACDKITKNLAPVRAALGPSATWAQVVKQAFVQKIPLSFTEATAGVPAPIDPAGDVYNTYGAVTLEATLDVLTGQVELTRADIIFDIGRSVNPDIDIGQIEGAFVKGLGYCLHEGALYYPNGSMQWWDYIPPTPWEMPTTMNVTLLNATPNPMSGHGEKGIGEPPVTMAYAVVECIEQAVAAANADASTGAAPRAASLPYRVQARHLDCNVAPAQFALS